MRQELSVKQQELDDQTARLEQTTMQLKRAEDHIAEMSRALTKLAEFKQTIIKSLESGNFDDNRIFPIPNRNDQATGFASSANRQKRNQSALHKNEIGHMSDTNISTLSTAAVNGSAGEYLDRAASSVHFEGINGIRSTNGTSSKISIHDRPTTKDESKYRTSQSLPSSPVKQPPIREESTVSDKDTLSEMNTDDFLKFLSAGSSASSIDLPALQAHQTKAKNAFISATSFHDNDPLLSGPAIDGKLFFREAKARLSYDAFLALVHNVKSYNSRQQTKAATLDNAAVLMAGKHQDLLKSFEKLVVES